MSEERAGDQSEVVCVCEECGYDFDFELPQQVVNAAQRGDLVLFAGAGISTEVNSVHPTTFYEECLSALSDSPEDDSFPRVMSAFEAEFGRRELVKRLKRRFDYIDAFSSLHWSATKFHRELSTMPYLSDIITTNWDTYFEQQCGATPVVQGEDFAFSDLVGRKVYKIHGSITSLASLVATQEDYGKRLEDLKSNALGGQLRTFLATKTIVFVGYSLRDWNFRELYEALLLDLGAFRPRAYVVSPFESEAANELGLVQFRTSGVAFLRKLKAELLKLCYLPDHIYPLAIEAHDEIVDANHAVADLSRRDYPESVYCLSYQNGILDALGRVIRRQVTGEYSHSHHVENLVRSYDHAASFHLERKNYWDASYAAGYRDAMLLLLVVGGRLDDISTDTPGAGHRAETRGGSGTDSEDSTGESGPVPDGHVDGHFHLGGGQGPDDEVSAAKDEDPDNGNEDEILTPPPFLAIGFGQLETFDRFDEYTAFLEDRQRQDHDVVTAAKQQLSRFTDDLIPHHTPFLEVPHGAEAASD